MTTLKVPPGVKFIKAWQLYRVGEVIHPSGTLRDWLMANGYVEFAEASPSPDHTLPQAKPGRKGRKR